MNPPRYRGEVDWRKWGVALVLMLGSPPRVEDGGTTTYVEPWQVHFQLGPLIGYVRGRIEGLDR